MFRCLSEVIACLNQRLSRTENYFITWRLHEIILFFKLRLKWHGLSVWRINAWSGNVVYARQTLFTCEWSNANKLWPPLLFPDCNANGIASIPGGFIVMEERVNRACHLKPCAGLKCKIFLLTATIFVGLQMIKKRKSADGWRGNSARSLLKSIKHHRLRPLYEHLVFVTFQTRRTEDEFEQEAKN